MASPPGWEGGSVQQSHDSSSSVLAGQGCKLIRREGGEQAGVLDRPELVPVRNEVSEGALPIRMKKFARTPRHYRTRRAPAGVPMPKGIEHANVPANEAVRIMGGRCHGAAPNGVSARDGDRRRAHLSHSKAAILTCHRGLGRQRAHLWQLLRSKNQRCVHCADAKCRRSDEKHQHHDDSIEQFH